MKSFRKISYILVLALMIISMFASTGIVLANVNHTADYRVVYADGYVDAGHSDTLDASSPPALYPYHLSCSEDLISIWGPHPTHGAIVSYSITRFKVEDDGTINEFMTCGGTAPTPTPVTPTPTPVTPTPTPVTPTPTPVTPTPTGPTPTPTDPTPTPTGTPPILIPVTGNEVSSISFIWFAVMVVLVTFGAFKVTGRIVE